MWSCEGWERGDWDWRDISTTRTFVFRSTDEGLSLTVKGLIERWDGREVVMTAPDRELSVGEVGGPGRVGVFGVFI